MPSGLKKATIVIALVVVAGVLGVQKYRMTHGGQGPGMMGMAMNVDVAEVKAQDVRLWHEFSGRLVAVDQAEIRPRVSGPIEAVDFKDGARVTKDDPLFTIDPKPYQAEVDRLQGVLGQAKAQATLAQTEFDRAEGLYKSKAISQSEYDQRRNNLNVADAAVKAAEAAVEGAQLNLDYTTVRAPIAGRAGRAEVTVGNVVQSGQNAPVLTTIVSDNPIYADFDMDEATYLKYTQGAKDGQHIPVKLGLATEDGTPHEGAVESFDNHIDTESGTIRVRAVFGNPDGALVPGLFARIQIAGAGTESALLITDRAVGTDQEKKYVLLLGADGTAQYREVHLGPAVDGLRVAESGLKEGDKVVVSGILPTLRPGMPLNPTVVPMTGAPPKPQAPEQKPAGDEEK